MHTLVIAHRGASSSRPENTFAAFERAVEIGADMIEFDVRRTRDGHLVVHHDADFSGHRIARLTLAQLRALPKGESVPQFSELLQRFAGRIKFDVELKEPGYEHVVVDLLHRYLEPGSYFVTSFRRSSLKRVKQLDWSIKTGLLVGRHERLADIRLREWFPFAHMRRIHADALLVHHGLSPRLEAAAVRQGIPLYVWTVDDFDEMRGYLERANVTGVITDHPAEALVLVAATA